MFLLVSKLHVLNTFLLVAILAVRPLYTVVLSALPYFNI